MCGSRKRLKLGKPTSSGATKMEVEPENTMPHPETSNQSANENAQDSTTTMPLIVRFYDPNIRAEDGRKRTLEDILSKDNQWFERCHDYVQMLFPLPEGSMFNYLAPIIDRQVFDEFRSRPELQTEMRKALRRMLRFYGFVLNDPVADTKTSKAGGPSADPETGVLPEQTNDSEPHAKIPEEVAHSQEEVEGKDNSTDVKSKPILIVRAPNHRRAFHTWVMRFNHNHLRITRILRSLRVLGLEIEARAFLDTLEDVHKEFKAFSSTSLTYWHKAIERPLWIAPDDERVQWLREIDAEGKENNEEMSDVQSP